MSCKSTCLEAILVMVDRTSVRIFTGDMSKSGRDKNRTLKPTPIFGLESIHQCCHRRTELYRPVL